MAIWGWQTLQLAWKGPESELKEGGNRSYDKTLDLCGVSQNLHFDVFWLYGLISGRYAWYQVIAIVITPCTVVGDGDCLYQFLTSCETEKSFFL